MIQEVIVVEGKQDAVRVKQAVAAEVITTGGFALTPQTLERIRQADEKRGIIILTDPDFTGERIRDFLRRRFPRAKHAFVPRLDATANGDVGIEQASVEAIRAALSKVRWAVYQPAAVFTMADMVQGGLSCHRDAAVRRAAVGAALGIGYSNAKQFLYRLNHYGVDRAEFMQALAALEEEI